MNLLNMPPIPNVKRIQYSNLESKNVWGKKINDVKLIYPTLEYMTVANGTRKCMIDHYTNHDNIIEKARFYSKKGLVIIPMEQNKISMGFSHRTNENNVKTHFRCVVSKSIQDAEEFINYHIKRDDINIGRMLGFPAESCEFFDEVWKKGYFDPVWQQAENSDNKKKIYKKNNKIFEENKIRLIMEQDCYLINPAFRYFNIRMISHFAKSLNNKDSIEVGKKWLQTALDLKMESINDLIDILKLPYEWECYKGIAQINTPVFKMVVSSLPTFPKYIVQQESDSYPKEAPTGIQFPWRLNSIKYKG